MRCWSVWALGCMARRWDPETAFIGFKKHAESGNASAQGVLGLMYANGQGAPKDYKQAMYWYLKSADQGDAQSQSYLGFMYVTGQGVPKDYKQAMYWFRKAADKGHAKGQFNLANGYYIKTRDIIEKTLTPQQRANAQVNAREWKFVK